MIPPEELWGPVKVFAQRDDSVPVVHIYLNFLTGARMDPAGQGGRARLSANMLRMGTLRRTREQITRAVEMLGADVDVSVSHHRVTVSGHVMTDMQEPFLDLLDEILNETGLREEDFEKLRRETLADIVQNRDDDQSVAYRHFRTMLFGEHPYARSTMGRHAEVASMSWRDVQNHHQTVLRRAPVLVGLAGDIDVDRLRGSIEPMLGAFTRSDLTIPETADPAPPRAIRVRLVDKPARTQSQIYLGHLGIRALDEDYFPVALLNTAFGGTYTARLSREVRQERGWSYGAYSRMLRSLRRDAFYLWTFPALENMVECIELQLDMLDELRGQGLTEEEFAFARSYLANHYLFAVETASLRVALALRQEVLELPPGFYANYRQSVMSVTPEQVLQASQRFVHPADLCICALCTADRVQPALSKLLGDQAVIEVVDWDSDA